MAGLGVLLCILAVAIPIGLLIGSVILRAAVSVSNKILGPVKSSQYEDDFEDDEDEDEDDEEFTHRRRAPRRGSTSAIPEPTIGRGMLIVLAAGIVNSVVNYAVGFMMGGAAAAGGRRGVDTAQIMAISVSIPIGFLVMAAMCTAILPTTFGRGCLVALFYNLIAIAIGVVIFLLILAVFGVGMGMGR